MSHHIRQHIHRTCISLRNRQNICGGYENAICADELARSRASEEECASEPARLLEFWLIHAKPRREPEEKD
jgi:hypothetical protein